MTVPSPSGPTKKRLKSLNSLRQIATCGGLSRPNEINGLAPAVPHETYDRAPIPIDRLRLVLRLDHTNGRLYWLSRTPDQFEARFPCRACGVWNSRYAGREALTTPDRNGYLAGHIFDRRVFAHRVSFALSRGYWPAGCIDHIDGKRANNHPLNLREVTHAENMRNTSLRSDSQSGITGVTWDKVNSRWRADIRADGRRFNLGRFACIEDAIAARRVAERKLGFHENHGKISPNMGIASAWWIAPTAILGALAWVQIAKAVL